MSRADDITALLDAYDAQLRAHVHERLPDSIRCEWDGPLLRVTGFGDRGFVGYRDLAGLEGDELDELIARQVRFFAGRGRASSGSCTATIGRPTSRAPPRRGLPAGGHRDGGDRPVGRPAADPSCRTE